MLKKYKKGVKCPQRSHPPWNKYLPKEVQPFYGKHHTEESKAYGNKSNLGKVFSKDHKEKISKSRMGTKLTRETKIKIGLANSGRKFSQEVNKKKGLLMEKNFFWKGGKKKNKYVYIKTDEAPELSRDKQGYVKRANLIWYIKTGEIIKSPFVLHHVDKNIENDSFKNLKKLTFKEHAELESNLRKRKIGRYL
jgi:hypothetical protein